MRTTNTLIVGGGQAGLAMSAHLRKRGVDHLVLERDRIAERWRSARWDSLVANGPAWHDRFPDMTFDEVGVGGEAFPGKEQVAAYFETFAQRIEAPILLGVEALRATARAEGGFRIETSGGVIDAENVVAATGPFQIPQIPAVAPQDPALIQMHSSDYRNADALPDGAVLVVGAGASGSQIADELNRAGRRVFLSVGPHERPMRRYRGRDFVWWLGVLGKWEIPTPPEGREHVTIAVSGAYGGQTVEFRRLAGEGITLLGMTQGFENGVLRVAPDLAANLKAGDAYYLDLLDEADAFVAREGLDLPKEPEARRIPPDPPCVTDPIRSVDLRAEGVTSIIWATGFRQDFGWLQVDAFDADGRPAHRKGVSKCTGVYFLGLPWLSMRGSSFIWGVWVDAERIASRIAGEDAATAAE